MSISQGIAQLDPETLGAELLYTAHPGPADVAFALTVLLQLRHLTITESSTNVDSVYARWTHAQLRQNKVDKLEQAIHSLTSHFFSEFRSNQEIETVLWTPFRVDDTSEKMLRVSDFLQGPLAPIALSKHPLFVGSLLHTWNYGKLACHSNQSSTRYDKFCSIPWNMHCIALISDLIYLSLLIHCLLFPQTQWSSIGGVLEVFRFREVVMAVYVISFLIENWSLAKVPYLLAIAAFAFSFPSTPRPGDATYSLLTCSAALHVFKLHLTRTPGPVFLFPLDRSLPLATFLKCSWSQAVLPAFIFFAPALFLTSCLLSYSLASTFTKLSDQLYWVFLPSYVPMEIRTIVLFLFFTIILSIGFSMFMFGTSLPSLVLKEPSGNDYCWDRFSPKIGHLSRSAAFRAVSIHVAPYHFPPPFNLLRVSFISIPSYTANLLGHPVHLEDLEKWLWRVTVGLASGIIKVLCLCCNLTRTISRA